MHLFIMCIFGNRFRHFCYLSYLIYCFDFLQHFDLKRSGDYYDQLYYMVINNKMVNLH